VLTLKTFAEIANAIRGTDSNSSWWFTRLGSSRIEIYMKHI